ncbi:MAG TPA: peptide chain release factor 2 [Nitrospirota bacterium]|nr:peptide chain release factor 2 [Nitrospirota bacterium]
MVEIVELQRELDALQDRVSALRGIFDLPGKEGRLAEITGLMEGQGFWEDAEAAQKLMKEKTALEASIHVWDVLRRFADDLGVMVGLSQEAGGEELLPDIDAGIKKLSQDVDSAELDLMLSGENDKRNAIVTIHPGAGGTESQDWAEMLLRMYLRWAERKGYKTEMVDLLPGEEAGIKSATFEVLGKNAYGYLKAEAGVHRLVRISPFDSNKRRHTSFASVFVYPEVEDDVQVAIDEKDLRIDTYRASGAGGQHVNKTSSAIRITHIPTNIVVQCQDERSQFKNKDKAFKVLRSRLYDLQVKKKEAEMDKMHSEKKDIAWGSQIRSYVFMPYQMAKDHRTGYEVGNISAVMDGDLDGFIEAFLLGKRAQPGSGKDDDI